MHKILIELILTNKCNKRCKYCDLDFKNKSLSFSDLDLFINFLKNNKANYTINFFGWEPLLEYDKLKYFVDNSKDYIFKFSIWTNWILLDKEKLEYFKNNNINIYLSVDNISIWKDLNLELLWKYKDIIIINFINDPDYLLQSISTFEKIKQVWFKNIAFMPIFTTKKWPTSKLISLKEIYKYLILNSKNINLKFFSYFNWISIDKQFILDTDLYFYSDIDSLLWLQKQYNTINIQLKNEIQNITKLINLTDNNINLNNLLYKYNIKNIVKLVFKIPKQSWDYITYKLINKILKNK